MKPLKTKSDKGVSLSKMKAGALKDLWSKWSTTRKRRNITTDNVQQNDASDVSDDDQHQNEPMNMNHEENGEFLFPNMGELAEI